MAQVAGLEFSTSAMLGQMASVPAPFLRPLEYVLELLEASPSLYRPITQADLAAGFPPPDWCLPLHMELAKCDALTANAAEQPPPMGAGAALPPRTEAEIAAALSGAPYWYVLSSVQVCYFYLASPSSFFHQSAGSGHCTCSPSNVHLPIASSPPKGAWSTNSPRTRPSVTSTGRPVT